MLQEALVPPKTTKATQRPATSPSCINSIIES